MYKFPILVSLKEKNPYGQTTVICNGISLSVNKKTVITTSSMFSKIEKLEKYLIIEEM